MIQRLDWFNSSFTKSYWKRKYELDTCVNIYLDLLNDMHMMVYLISKLQMHMMVYLISKLQLWHQWEWCLWY